MEPLLRTLFVHTPGTRLALDGNSIKASRDDVPPRRLPLEAIDTIVVAAGVDVSTKLLIRCAEQGRVVAFVSAHGKPRAIVEGAADGRSELRRRQYAAHADPAHRARLAASIVEGKVRQMGWALRQWARDASDDQRAGLRETASRLDETLNQISGNVLTRDELLGVEGESTRRYFSAMGGVVNGGVWQGRVRRPTTDPLNAMLSWFYGMTRISVHGGVMVAGLDPGTGFLHGDRPGQPSLVLDLMEELRPAADRLAVKLWNTKQIQEKHFRRGLGGAVEVNDVGREVLFENWHRHRTADVPVLGRRHPVPNGFVPVMQAHALANAIRHGTPYLAHRNQLR